MENEGRDRRSIRLRGYDYSKAGAYFLTICTYNRKSLFGEIKKGEMCLNDLGRLLEEEWCKSALVRSEIELDSWVVMPNHLHGIVMITAGDVRVVPDGERDQRTGEGDQPVAPTGGVDTGTRRKSIGALVAGFKSAATSRINSMRGTPCKPVWQRNYYEHVFRNQEALEIIRRYIMDNPARWDEDPENPYRRLNAV